MKLKLFYWVWFSIFLVALSACRYGEPVPSGKVVFTQDSALREDGDQGLDVKILNFQWRYLAHTDQLKVSGTVQNNGTNSVQGCIIQIDAFDQFASPLGHVETYINPTYLAAGQEGFFTVFLNRGHWVENMRLRYRFETNY